MSSPNPFSIKIVFLGESGTGKTSIVTKYVSGSIPEVSVPTVGAAFVTKDIIFNKKTVQLLIWDTAGQELYRGLAPMYYRNAVIAFIVYDVTNAASYKAVEYWINELKEKGEEQMVLVICGNKIDLEERVVEEVEAQAFASGHNAIYVETSAVSGQGIDRMFQNAISELIKLQSSNRVSHQQTSSNSIQIENTNQSSCC
ncbi:small GTP-binding protein [Histomonas meleagridis]|uniref:small GTP-binding protein n=1 Tax=Histomonas meleagridis TaxID=135588 RepID=UPI00355A4F17|nr:small GTP-binding protein [Histomonas meleagridis]KAH0796633.1 small GTP-binding protein [Histomonas meleagridis]